MGLGLAFNSDPGLHRKLCLKSASALASMLPGVKGLEKPLKTGPCDMDCEGRKTGYIPAMLRLPKSLAIALSLVLTACGPVGGLHGDRQNPETGEMENATFSKYFDDGQWLLEGKVGISVVVDNETPMTRQMFGGLTGKDSEGTGKVTAYFWNFDTKEHRVGKLHLSHNGKGWGTKDSGVLAAAKPWSRTGAVLGEIPIDTYTTELKVKLIVEVDGKTVERRMVLKRRTVDDNRRYFGPGGRPPYPWANRL